MKYQLFVDFMKGTEMSDRMRFENGYLYVKALQIKEKTQC